MTPEQLYEEIWNDWQDYVTKIIRLKLKSSTGNPLKDFSENYKHKEIVLLADNYFGQRKIDTVPEAMKLAIKDYPVINTKLYKAML